LNAFLEVSGLEMSSVLDGEGAHVNDGTRAKDGSEAGPKIKTSANDFIVARYYSTPEPRPTAAPAPWVFKPSYAYVPNTSPGTYEPTLTGEGTGKYCMSVAAFKAAASAPVPPAASQK